MRKRLLTVASLFLFLAFGFVSAASAQTGGVTGTVADAETGETIPGANVQIVELNRGAATNPEGVYEITNVSSGTYTLRVSFVGYQVFQTPIEIPADETITRDIELEPGAIGLDEVVVTGYSQRRRADITGAVTSVESAEIQDVPVQNLSSSCRAVPRV